MRKKMMIGFIIITFVFLLCYFYLDNGTCIVTMTTLPERLKSDYFHQVIENILQQKPDFIILNIPYVCKRSDEVYVLPNWLLEHDNIIINRCEDFGPSTKVLGSLSMLPKNANVVHLDDDIIYQNFTLDGLLKSLRHYPNDVSCWYTENGTGWGFSGCIAKSETYEILDKNQLTNECRFVDDDWFAFMYKQANINVRSVDPSKSWNYNCKSIDNHPNWFELQHHTNRKLLQEQCKQSLQSLH
jgi:hypothetical protein